MRRPLAVLSLAAATLLAGCPDEEPLCTPEREKAAVLDLARDWYLYPELLPAQVDLAAYAGPEDLLDALTADARAAGQDRGWSFVTTASAQQSFFVEGTSVGFGIGLLVREPRLFVSQVYAGSAAADEGFRRGDEILAIGDSPGALTPVAELIAADALGAAFGPSAAGVERTFQVAPAAGGPAEPRTMTKRTYDLDPVPAWTRLTRAGLPDAGYVALRTFIAPAEAPLQQAFMEFGQAGITDVVVDLRYNGGGLVSTAELLANLLGAGLATTDVMFRLENNARHADRNETVRFAPPPDWLAPFRVAFVTTGASASASELVPNVLEPWREIALVGARTYGKPVGQRGFRLSGCDLVVYLVSFRLVNSQEEGSYFGGLPDLGFDDCTIAAEDDLAHETWESAETSTAAALDWLSTGACPATPLGALAATRDAYPEPREPSLAQRHVRGLY